MNAVANNRGAGGARRAEDGGPVRVRRRSGSRGAPATQNPRDMREAGHRISALKRWERLRVRRRRSHIRGVGYVGLAVYEYLVKKAVQSAGRLDDLPYARIAAAVGHSRSAVVAAVARLKTFGWLDWFRRWETNKQTGQLEQICNAFWICVPTAALQRLGIRCGPPPPPDDAAADQAKRAEYREKCEAAAFTLRPDMERASAIVAEAAALRGDGPDTPEKPA